MRARGEERGTAALVAQPAHRPQHGGVQERGVRGGRRAARAAPGCVAGPAAVQHLPGVLQPAAQLYRWRRVWAGLQDHGGAAAEPGRGAAGSAGAAGRAPDGHEVPAEWGGEQVRGGQGPQVQQRVVVVCGGVWRLVWRGARGHAAGAAPEPVVTGSHR